MATVTVIRFLQTDPVGYGGGINLYAYVGNDPVNLVDPLGLRFRVGCVTDPDSGFTHCFNNTVPDSAALVFSHGSGPVPGPSEGGSGAAPAFPPCTGLLCANPLTPKPPKPPKPSKRPKGNFCSASPDQPWGVDASEACRQHDLCYGDGEPKSQCDRKLMSDIYQQCRAQGGEAATCGVVAGIYYAGVRNIISVFYYWFSGIDEKYMPKTPNINPSMRRV